MAQRDDGVWGLGATTTVRCTVRDEGGYAINDAALFATLYDANDVEVANAASDGVYRAGSDGVYDIYVDGSNLTTGASYRLEVRTSTPAGVVSFDEATRVAGPRVH